MYPKTLNGNTVQVPEDGDDNWGPQATAWADDLIDMADGTAFITAGGVVIPYLKGTSSTLGPGGTLTPAYPRHKVKGISSAVTLSGTQAIASGSKDGQFLRLQGDDATLTVTIQNGSGVALKGGDVTLGLYETIDFHWDASLSKWVEDCRTPALKLTNQTGIDLYELAANGLNKITLKAPSSLASDLTLTLPSSIAAGQFLTTDGSGNLSWAAGTSVSLQQAYTVGAGITETLGNPIVVTFPGGQEMLRLTAASGNVYHQAISGSKTLRVGSDITGPYVGSVNFDSLRFLTNNSTWWTIDPSGAFSGTTPFTSGLLTGLSHGRFAGSVVSKGPGPWYDVTHPDWGVVGGDTGDQTAAIQTVITSAVAAGGGTIYFPPGTYRHSGSIQIPINARNITLLGYGAVLHCVQSFGTALIVSDTTTTNDRIEKFAIHGLRFEGLGMTDSGTCDGIVLNACLDAVLRDVVVQNFSRNGIVGIKSSASGSTYWNQVTLDHVKVRFCGEMGLQVGYVGPAADDLTIVGSMFNNLGKKITSSSAGDGGVYINSHTLTWCWGEVSAVRNENNTNGYKNGAVLRGCTGALLGVHWENNCNNQAGSNDLRLDTDAHGLVIIGSDHSCDQTTAAKCGIFVGGSCADVSIVGAKHNTNNVNHRFDYLVDVAAGVNPMISGLGTITGGVAPATAWVNKASTTKLVGAIQGVFYRARDSAGGGTGLAGGNFALSGGFGSTASVSLISGKDQRFRFRVTSSGTGQGASPTITLTFADGAWEVAPYAVVSREGGDQPTITNLITTTTTTLTITFNGTPVAGQVYDFVVVVVG